MGNVFRVRRLRMIFTIVIITKSISKTDLTRTMSKLNRVIITLNYYPC